MSITTRITRLIAQRLHENAYVERMGDRNQQTTLEKTIYLTFDDGPHLERTPALLDNLAALNLKATFFVLGRNMGLGKELIRRAIKEGHSVGSHSWSHWQADKTSNRDWIEDVAKARRELENITGRSCRLFRPPYGALTPLKLLHLIKNDYRIIHWALDTKDFEAKSPQKLKAWFENTPPIQNGIVLMHDDKEYSTRYFNEVYAPWLGKANTAAIPMD